MKSSHWLVNVLRKTQASLELPGHLSDAEAWRTAQAQTGLSAHALAEHVASFARTKVADVGSSSAIARRLVPERLVRQYQVLPLREDDRQIVVASLNPLDMDAEQAIRFASGRMPLFEVATPDELRHAIDMHYRGDENLDKLLGRIEAVTADSVMLIQADAREALSAQETNAQPVVKLTNYILQEATRRRASDVHIEPGPAGAMVRFRVDGVLREFMTLPLPAMSRVVSRLKIIGDLDIADRRRPQDGHARIRVDNRSFDLRISTVPVQDAEKAVVRISSTERSLTLNDIDLTAVEGGRMRELLGHRDGIVVVTGPTGSGKTTTLYAALRELHNGERNISTVEDPVEYQVPGIAQIQVDPKGGVTFASALRALLRQDPDVILVGEVRDAETAEIALQAASTGHLVLTTLHTNDAVGVLQRLTDLDVDRPSVAGSLRGAIGQRLVRRLCDVCAKPAESGSPLEAKYNVKAVRTAVGCDHCDGTGYRGRLPIMEVLIMSPELEKLIVNGGSAADLQAAAVRNGMRPMTTVALTRVSEGVTTLEEVDRVFGAATVVEERKAPVKQHVLITDDDDVNRSLVKFILETEGFTVSEAVHGQAAIDTLGKVRDISLVVLDLDMPIMDGRETLRYLKATPATTGIPIIVLTGSANPDDEVRLIDQGAEDYIRKPFTPDRFMSRVRAVLRRSGTSLHG